MKPRQISDRLRTNDFMTEQGLPVFSSITEIWINLFPRLCPFENESANKM